jgi:hypothetical protein
MNKRKKEQKKKKKKKGGGITVRLITLFGAQREAEMAIM